MKSKTKWVVLASLSVGIVLGIIVKSHIFTSSEVRITNSINETVVIEEDEATFLVEYIQHAREENKQIERPKFLYSNKLVYYDNQGQHIVKFTSPYEISDSNESIVSIDDYFVKIDIDFYRKIQEISMKKGISLRVD